MWLTVIIIVISSLCVHFAAFVMIRTLIKYKHNPYAESHNSLLKFQNN